jgi:ribose transport system permease protein
MSLVKSEIVDNTQKNRIKFKVGRELITVIALVVIIGIFAAINPQYIQANNLLDIIDQTVINGLIAVGITFAILTAGIDLSVGSILAIAVVVIGKFLVNGMNPVVAVIAGIIVGFVLGAVNGLLITKMKLQPFIATLGTMSMYRGLAYILTGGQPVLNIPKSFRTMLDGDVVGNVSISIIILIVFAVICHIILRKTKQGIYMYSIGGNEEATKLSGIKVDRTKILAYGICGIAAALAGMIMLARLGTGEPAAGQGYELNAIAATAIGGASLAGGKGSIPGTILGAILLSALKIGLIVVGVDTFWQYIATGGIIVVAVYFETIQEIISTKMKSKKK